MRDSGLPGIRLEKSAGNNGGAEKSRAQSRVERFPVNFSLVGHRSDTRKYAEVGPEGRYSLLALTSSGPSVN